jgi:hypothetical protein
VERRKSEKPNFKRKDEFTVGCTARRSGCAYSLGRAEGGQLLVLRVWRR